MNGSLRILAVAILAILSVPFQHARGAEAPNSAPVMAFHPPERLFGYYIGDMLESAADLTLPQGTVLDTASLPAPGDLNYWLVLRAVNVSRKPAAGGGERVRIRMRYQTFYDPLEPKKMLIPGFQLGAHDANGVRAIDVPAWQFMSSPIREVSAGKDVDAAYLQPDHQPSRPDIARPRRGALIAGGVALLALLSLGWSHGWLGAAFRRRSRPFRFALRQIRRGRGMESRMAYQQGLKALHEAFNRTEGGVVLAEDVPSFLHRHARFAGLAAEIEGFFAASRHWFYAAETNNAMHAFPPAAILALARKLSRSERA